jgi:fumarate reductase subunit C
MIRRSGKMQFLFWAFFFSVMLYLWILTIGVQTFILPDEKPLAFPQNIVSLMFILYGFLVLFTLAGTVVSIMVGNKKYINLFGAMVIVVFGTIVATKGIFG